MVLLKLSEALEFALPTALETVLMPAIQISVNKDIAKASRTALDLPHHHIYHSLPPGLILFAHIILALEIVFVCDFCLVMGIVRGNVRGMGQT